MTGAVLMSAQHEVCTSKDVHLHLSHVAIVLLASWLREAYPGCCKLEAVARHYSLTASYSLIHEGFLDVVFCSTSECVPESPINSSQQWVHIRSSAQGLNLKSTQPRACVRVPDEAERTCESISESCAEAESEFVRVDALPLSCRVTDETSRVFCD